MSSCHGDWAVASFIAQLGGREQATMCHLAQMEEAHCTFQPLETRAKTRAGEVVCFVGPLSVVLLEICGPQWKSTCFHSSAPFIVFGSLNQLCRRQEMCLPYVLYLQLCSGKRLLLLSFPWPLKPVSQLPLLGLFTCCKATLRAAPFMTSSALRRALYWEPLQILHLSARLTCMLLFPAFF